VALVIGGYDQVSELEKFFKSDPQGERVIGTYLYPYRLFGEPDWNDPYSATAVIANVQVGSDELLITCNGGLFIRPPANLSDLLSAEIDPGKDDLKAKLAFEEKAANAFNRVICEFALKGIVSEPATPVHISRGELINDHALIRSASGGREIYLERTTMPLMQLLQRTWRMNQLHDLDVVEAMARQECTSQLVQVSDYLPTLVAGAYSLFSQRQLSEALIDSWIVVEQIIDWLWTDYLLRIADKSRKKRLSDPRTYSAAVQIEILHTIGVLPLSLYQALNTARKHRNDLAHRAEISLTMATEGVTAMKQIIEFLCKTSVEPPSVSVGVNW
jgi:hypothetical protein